MPPPKGPPPSAARFTELREGIEFTWQGSSLVLTEEYLHSLGKCCQSGCRRCPWQYRREASTHAPSPRRSPMPSPQEGSRCDDHPTHLGGNQ